MFSLACLGQLQHLILNMFLIQKPFSKCRYLFQICIDENTARCDLKVLPLRTFNCQHSGHCCDKIVRKDIDCVRIPILAFKIVGVLGMQKCFIVCAMSNCVCFKCQDVILISDISSSKIHCTLLRKRIVFQDPLVFDKS